MQSDDWLESLYAIENADEGLDAVFNHIDDLMLAGEFSEVDSILENVDPNRLQIDVLLGFLTITLPVKNKLRNRSRIWREAKEIIKQTKGQTYANELMDKWE